MLKCDLDAMLAKAMDPDDKVRAAVCKAYGELDFETSAYHASELMLRTIAGRCLDKKVRFVFLHSPMRSLMNKPIAYCTTGSF